MTTLAKYAMSYAAFDPQKHPRDDHGRFAGGHGGSNGAPSFRVRPLAEPSPGPRAERRSPTRGESWQRIGSKIAALPSDYTGSAAREAPVDFFKHLSITWQHPKAAKPGEHQALLGQFKQIIAEHREPAIAKGKETRRKVAVHGIKDKFTEKRRTGELLIPENTPSGAAHRAYNHAAMLALHDAGVLRYDYKMSDAQKSELAPLEPFMRSVRGRLKNAFAIAAPGHRGPYLKEFGATFADQRRDKQTGAVRRRFLPTNQQLVKLSPSDITAAAANVQEPTDGQLEPGNYRKGHVSIAGLRIAIETPKGAKRRGIGANGKPWSVTMPAHYGYVKGTEGADGDHVDVYLGPRAHEVDKHPVHIVDQVDAESGRFDEHKCMLGFPTRAQALRTYDRGFSDGKGPKRRGAVTAMRFEDFRAWLKGKNTREPVSQGIKKMADLPFAQPLAKAVSPAQKAKVSLTLREFKAGKLRAWRGRNAKGGVRRGPVVRDRAQAIAIALRQAGLSKAAPSPDPTLGCTDPRVVGMAVHAHDLLRKEGRKHAAGAADPHVVMVMPDMHRLVGTTSLPQPADVRRNNAMIADSRLPLAAVLGKRAGFDRDAAYGRLAAAARENRHSPATEAYHRVLAGGGDLGSAIRAHDLVHHYDYGTLPPRHTAELDSVLKTHAPADAAGRVTLGSAIRDVATHPEFAGLRRFGAKAAVVGGGLLAARAAYHAWTRPAKAEKSAPATALPLAKANGIARPRMPRVGEPEKEKNQTGISPGTVAAGSAISGATETIAAVPHILDLRRQAAARTATRVAQIRMKGAARTSAARMGKPYAAPESQVGTETEAAVRGAEEAGKAEFRSGVLRSLGTHVLPLAALGAGAGALEAMLYSHKQS